MSESTPLKISDQIVAFCQEIDSTEEPSFLSFQPTEKAELHECFRNVESHIALYSGDIQYGWIIWESPNRTLNAEFHAVWVSPTGELLDITPKVDGEIRILFLPDSTITFRGQLIENRKKVLVDNTWTRQWIWEEHNFFLIKQKHYRNRQVDIESFRAECEKWLEAPDARTPQIGPNRRCICGSRKKFKSCCAEWWAI